MKSFNWKKKVMLFHVIFILHANEANNETQCFSDCCSCCILRGKCFYLLQHTRPHGRSRSPSVALIDRSESMPLPPREQTNHDFQPWMAVASSGFEHAGCSTTCQRM